MSMSRTVLIVDDHPSFRASARAMLESEGFVVVGEAEDGAGALRAVEAIAPDIVVLDVQLPDMTGFDVCAELERRYGAPPDIILVSSRDVSDYGELVSSSCACGFVAEGRALRRPRGRPPAVNRVLLVLGIALLVLEAALAAVLLATVDSATGGAVGGARGRRGRRHPARRRDDGDRLDRDRSRDHGRASRSS